MITIIVLIVSIVILCFYFKGVKEFGAEQYNDQLEILINTIGTFLGMILAILLICFSIALSGKEVNENMNLDYKQEITIDGDSKYVFEDKNNNDIKLSNRDFFRQYNFKTGKKYLLNVTKTKVFNYTISNQINYIARK